MKRAFIPGAMDRHGIAHPLPHCTGSCNQGRTVCTCATGQTECALAVPPRPWVPVRPAITVHQIPMLRRVRRFLGRFWAFLTTPKWQA